MTSCPPDHAPDSREKFLQRRLLTLSALGTEQKCYFSTVKRRFVQRSGGTFSVVGRLFLFFIEGGYLTQYLPRKRDHVPITQRRG